MNYLRFKSQRFWYHFLSFPFIWAPLVAVLFLDLLISLYQLICFPLYRLEIVKRSAYISVLDRSRLEYLNPWEKINCMYCGYVNGFLLYAKEIAGRTEQYWCGIMHADRPGFQLRQDHIERKFARFGDKQDFKNKYGPV